MREVDRHRQHADGRGPPLFTTHTRGPAEGARGRAQAPVPRGFAAGAPGIPVGDIFPLIALFAVANTALINMMMASRLLYGMAKQRVLPPALGRVLEGRRTPWVAILFTTAIAVALLLYVQTVGGGASTISLLGGTTALLLLAVFTVVNIACLVLRKDTVAHRHFRAPTAIPVIGVITCAYLVTPLTGRNPQQYVIAGGLLVLGLILWVITHFVNKATWGNQPPMRDPEALEGAETRP